MRLKDDYFAAYRSLKLTRDADGVLVAEFHTQGGPFRFTAQDHTEFVEAFYRIAQDRENKIVILTGAGGEVIPEIDFGNELPACSRQNHNLVLSILSDPVKGLDKLRMILCRESERPALGVKFGNQHTVSIPRQFQ